MGVLHSHAAKIATAAGGTRRPSARRVGGRGVACPKLGAACLHGKVRLGSGHLGLIGVAVHGDKVGGHAVKVYVFLLGGAALWPAYDLMRSHKLAGRAGIFRCFACSGGVATWLNGAVCLSRAL